MPLLPSLIRLGMQLFVSILALFGAVATDTLGDILYVAEPAPKPALEEQLPPLEPALPAPENEGGETTEPETRPPKEEPVAPELPASPAVSLPFPVTPVELSQTLTGDQVNANTRAALVNILCTTAGSGYLHPISGSGVVIDQRGVILTNAHVGQFFLLRDYPTKDGVECLVRTGSPAAAKYKAELLYLSPGWVLANAESIKLENPTGTGEQDFALLRITELSSGAPLPEGMLPFVAPETGVDPTAGTPILVAGYPAGFLGGTTIQTSLYATSAESTVQRVFTFRETTIDLISTGGTVVAQKGSSGGAVVDRGTGKLIGLIVTSTQSIETANRDLRAITLSHVERALQNEAGLSLAELLEGDLARTAAEFNTRIAPRLTEVLTGVLNRQ